MGADAAHLRHALCALLGADRDERVQALQRLSGGANMETWAFDLDRGERVQPLILRRRPPGLHAAIPALERDASGCAGGVQGIPLAAEAELLRVARRAGVPVPTVIATSAPHEPLGEALVMTRVQGEALPRKILREERFAAARSRLAFQCGEALARLHGVALDQCPPGLRDEPWRGDLQRLQALCDQFGNRSAVHQLALNVLKAQPEPGAPRVLCHGDFRLGNLLLGASGLHAVLDWELAHVGYAAEDLGYLCANVWRFGGAAPVAGCGAYRQLLDGYRSVRDTAPALREVQLFELYAALGWGLVCLTMLALHESGADPGLERAAVGRRLCESEIDLLLLLETLGL